MSPNTVALSHDAADATALIASAPAPNDSGVSESAITPVTNPSSAATPGTHVDGREQHGDDQEVDRDARADERTNRVVQHYEQREDTDSLEEGKRPHGRRLVESPGIVSRRARVTDSAARTDGLA